MSNHPAYRQPISGWSRALSALLAALCVLGIVLFIAAVSHNGVPRPGYHEVLGIAFAVLLLTICLPVALTGNPPRFWTRFEARYTGPHRTVRALNWLRRPAHPPRWAWRLSIGLWIFLALGHATISTIALSDLLESRRTVVILAVDWCVTLAVVGALIKWWRADLPSSRASSVDPNGDR
jgi:hypothetical protein